MITQQVITQQVITQQHEVMKNKRSYKQQSGQKQILTTNELVLNTKNRRTVN